MTKRRTILVRDLNNPYQLHKVELPPTGLDQVEDVVDRLIRLEQKYGIRPKPTPRKTRQ